MNQYITILEVFFVVTSILFMWLYHVESSNSCKCGSSVLEQESRFKMITGDFVTMLERHGENIRDKVLLDCSAGSGENRFILAFDYIILTRNGSY